MVFPSVFHFSTRSLFRSATEFCAERGIRPKTFGWWRWHLREELRARKQKEEIRLLPVKVAPAMAIPACAACARYVAIVVGDVEVRIEVGTEVAYVATLVAELRSRC